jgi:hypothetical protein
MRGNPAAADNNGSEVNVGDNMRVRGVGGGVGGGVGCGCVAVAEAVQAFDLMRVQTNL